jgi:hypothetical protein
LDIYNRCAGEPKDRARTKVVDLGFVANVVKEVCEAIVMQWCAADHAVQAGPSRMTQPSTREAVPGLAGAVPHSTFACSMGVAVAVVPNPHARCLCVCCRARS